MNDKQYIHDIDSDQNKLEVMQGRIGETELRIYHDYTPREREMRRNQLAMDRGVTPDEISDADVPYGDYIKITVKTSELMKHMTYVVDEPFLILPSFPTKE